MDAKQVKTSESWMSYVPYMIFLTILFSLLGLGLNAWHGREEPIVAAIDGAAMGLIIAAGRVWIKNSATDRISNDS